MFLFSANKFTKGYINIDIEGFFVERFFNLCSNEGIKLWGTQKNRKGVYSTYIAVQDFKKIKTIAKNTKSIIKIRKKKGIPFLIEKYKRRKVFIFLFFIIISTILTLSNFVWNIEIEGNSAIQQNEILELLNQNGIKIGAFKRKINTNIITEKIKLSDSRISWIGIELEGTNAKISIVEAIPKPEILDENELCDIVAEKDGIITQIDVTNGTAIVQVGDIVEKGNKLIAGWMEGKYTGVRYMHATGRVLAKVWYSEEKEEKFEKVEKVQTHNVENKYGISINKKTINLYKTLSKFEKYDTMETKNKLRLFNNFYLPIELKKVTNYEYIEEPKVYSEEELQDIIIKDLEEKLKDKIENKEIINRNVITEKTDTGLRVRLIYEVTEEIGIEQKLV